MENILVLVNFDLHQNFKLLADSSVQLRDRFYHYLLTTKIGPLVERINIFLEENSYTLFWGGALLLMYTQPYSFFAGAAMGIAFSAMVPPGPASVDLSALRQLLKSVAYAASPLLALSTQCFLGSITPGYHLYRIFRADYYPGYKNYYALAHELQMVSRELSSLCFWPSTL